MKKLFVVVSILMFVCALSVLAEEPKATPKPAATATSSGFSPTEPAHHGAVDVIDITRLDCVVQGTPVEFPDDIYLKNTGNTVVKKGTKIHWEIPNSGRKGDYTFTADLAPGSGIMVSGVVGGGFSAGVKCDVSILSKPKMMAVKPAVAMPILQMSLQCVVQGSPVEFPNDLYITNNRSTTIPKGKIIQWSMPNTAIKGEYTLTEDLLPQKSTYLSDILGGGLTAGLKCNAKVK